MNKKTMTINLPENEMILLEKICSEKGLTKNALVRQSLQVYICISERGDKVMDGFLELPLRSKNG